MVVVALDFVAARRKNAATLDERDQRSAKISPSAFRFSAHDLCATNVEPCNLEIDPLAFHLLIGWLVVVRHTVAV